MLLVQTTRIQKVKFSYLWERVLEAINSLLRLADIVGEIREADSKAARNG